MSKAKFPPVIVKLCGGKWDGMKMRFYKNAPPPPTLTYSGTTYTLTETERGEYLYVDNGRQNVLDVTSRETASG